MATVTLLSSDGVVFHASEAAARQSKVIADIITAVPDDGTESSVIPVVTVTAAVLSRVIEYCNKHAGAGDCEGDHELRQWDAEFGHRPLRPRLRDKFVNFFDLCIFLFRCMHILDLCFFDQTANWLNMKGLLDLACQALADMIKGKTPEEIRKIDVQPPYLLHSRRSQKGKPGAL